jgi:hypothetical protein
VTGRSLLNCKKLFLWWPADLQKAISPVAERIFRRLFHRWLNEFSEDCFIGGVQICRRLLHQCRADLQKIVTPVVERSRNHPLSKSKPAKK